MSEQRLSDEALERAIVEQSVHFASFKAGANSLVGAQIRRGLDALLDLRDCCKERDELRAALAEAKVLVRSEQHPDCVVILRSALGWLRDGWTKEARAALGKQIDHSSAVEGERAQGAAVSMRERALSIWLMAWGAFRAGHVCSAGLCEVPPHDDALVSHIEGEIAAIYREGFAAGAQAQREADVIVCANTSMFPDISEAAEAVASAPLVEPPEGE